MEYTLTYNGGKKRYRVSTITSVGSVNSALDLPKLYTKLRLKQCEGEGGGAPCFTSIKIRDQTISWTDGPELREPLPSSEEPIQRGGVRTHFGSQVTLVLEMDGTRMNVKAFKNGSVQLTGVKRIDQGRRAIEHLVDALKLCGDAVESPDKLCAGGYRVCLINSDLDLGFQVKRDRLYTFVRDAFPDVMCTYEPCNYHGVKFKYMWNSCNAVQGVCRCKEGVCKGNAAGDGDGSCRKVTVAVFQSGKVIAVGARTIEQLEDAIRFLLEEVCSEEHRGRFELAAGPRVPA